MTDLRIAWINRTLYDLSDTDNQGWLLWLQRHELPDPSTTPINTEIVCDDYHRRVICTVWATDTDGNYVADGYGGLKQDKVIVQLEARALPLPRGYEITRV